MKDQSLQPKSADNNSGDLTVHKLPKLGVVGVGLLSIAGWLGYEASKTSVEKTDPELNLRSSENRSNEFLPDVSVSGWLNSDRAISLDSLKGKVVLLNFWATWCPPCREEIPLMNELQKEYRQAGLVVLSITDEPVEEVWPFVDPETPHKTRIETIVGVGGEKVLEKYRVESRPAIVLLDENGRVVFSASGVQNKNFLQEKITKALQSLDVSSAGPNPIQGMGAGDAFEHVNLQEGRPDKAYGAGALNRLKTAMFEKVRSSDSSPISKEEVLELGRFYESNLPKGSWSGDSHVRESVVRVAMALYSVAQFPSYLREDLLKLFHRGLTDTSNNIREASASLYLSTFSVQAAGRETALQNLNDAISLERIPEIQRDMEQARDYILYAPSDDFLQKLFSEDSKARIGLAQGIQEDYNQYAKLSEIQRTAIIIALNYQIRRETNPILKQNMQDIVTDLESLRKVSSFQKVYELASNNESGSSSLNQKFKDFQARWKEKFESPWLDTDTLRTLFDEIKALPLLHQGGHLNVNAALIRMMAIDLLSGALERGALSRDSKRYVAEQLAAIYLNENGKDWFYDYRTLRIIGQTGVGSLSETLQLGLFEAVKGSEKAPETLSREERLIELMLLQELPSEATRNP